MNGRLNADDLMFASVRARYLESPGTVAARLREAVRQPGGLEGVTPAQALVAAGRLLTDAGELAEAVTILRTAADLAPPGRDDHGARIALAIALALSGDSQLADVLFPGGLSNKARLGFGQRVQVALALADAGQEAEAMRWADAALEHATKKRMGRPVEAVARKLQGTVPARATRAAARRSRPAGAAPGGTGPWPDHRGTGGSDAIERAGPGDDTTRQSGSDGDATGGAGASDSDAPAHAEPDADVSGSAELDSDVSRAADTFGGAEPDADTPGHAEPDADAPAPAPAEPDTDGAGDTDPPAPAEPDAAAAGDTDPDTDTPGHAEPDADGAGDIDPDGPDGLAGAPEAEPGQDVGAGRAGDVTDDAGTGGAVADPPVLAVAPNGTVLWWPQSEYLRLARQLPGLAFRLGPGWAGHTARTEAGLRTRASASPGRIALVAADFGQFATYLRKDSVDPRDPDVLTGYAAVAAANGTATAWPPRLLRACWCGSGRRYRRCCAVTGAAILAG